MVTAINKVVFDLDYQQEGYLVRALKLLDESDSNKRLKGYCLVYSRFDWLPKEVRYHIIQKWNNECKDDKAFTKLKKNFNKKFR